MDLKYLDGISVSKLCFDKFGNLALDTLVCFVDIDDLISAFSVYQKFLESSGRSSDFPSVFFDKLVKFRKYGKI